MDDPNTILTLSPADSDGYALDACRLSHNQVRHFSPSVDYGPSRETTPADVGTSGCGGDGPVNHQEYFHHLRLTFDQETKVPGRIAFGSDGARCDVLLAQKRRRYDISGLHFYITFDTQRRLVLQDVSTYGTSVGYDEQAGDQRRHNFPWILFFDDVVDMREKQITVTLWRRHPKDQQKRIAGLAFKIHLPLSYKKGQQGYRENVERFIADAANALPALNSLAFSHDTSVAPSEALSPTQRPIYLEHAELGRGAFGLVRKVIDASTGFKYAEKQFFQKTGWERELKIMRQIHHENIVKFIDFHQKSDPRLVMEYLQLGNLEHQHDSNTINEEDMVECMHQCLKAVSFLHHHNVTHRDIKPPNILVSSRSPFKIKLADFGLAQDRSTLRTFCGNPKYSAPEIFLNQPYSNAVDIWPVAVIMIEFVYNGFSQIKRRKIGGDDPTHIQAWSLDWCRRLIAAADDLESDILTDFLTKYMLKWDPCKRLSAAACLKKGSEIGLFNGAVSMTGNVTPRLQPRQGIGNINVEDAPTFLVDSLRRDVSSGVLRREEYTAQLLHPAQVIPNPKEFEPSHESIWGGSGNEKGISFDSQGPYKRSAKRRRTMNHYNSSQLGDTVLPSTSASLAHPRILANGYPDEVNRYQLNTLNIGQPSFLLQYQPLTIGDGDSTPTPQNPCLRDPWTADEILTDPILLGAHGGTENYAIPEQLYLEYQETIPRLNDFAVTPTAPHNLADEKLALLEELSSGRCGTVFKAIDNRGHFYAVKVFNVSQAQTTTKKETTEQVMLQEIENMSRLKHKHVISIIQNKFVDIPQPTLVMEFMAMGSLEQHHDLCKDEIFLMLQQLLDAISHLHDHDFAHRDIKPANILVGSRTPLLIKISGFGFTSQDPLTTFCGFFLYAAPEIVKEEVQYSKMVDIYAIGVLILECFHYYSKKDLPPPPDPFDVYIWRWRLIISSLTILQSGWRAVMILAKEMLDLSPQRRPAARSCLQNLDPSGEARERSDPGVLVPFKEVEKPTLVTHLTIDPQKATKSTIHFNKTSIQILEIRSTEVNISSRYIVKAKNIYQALNRRWNGHFTQNIPRVIIEKTSKDLNGIYVSLNCALILTKRFGGTDLRQKIYEFAKDNNALSEITSLKSFSELKTKFPTAVHIGELEDLPLAINLSILFKANGLSNHHIRKHLPLIHQGPHYAIKGSSNYPPRGVYTTIETAIAILKERGLTETSEQLQKYQDRDLWSPLMVAEPDGVVEATPTTATAGTEYDGAASPPSIPVTETLDYDGVLPRVS